MLLKLEGFTHFLEGFAHLLEVFTHVLEVFTHNYSFLLLSSNLDLLLEIEAG